MVIKRRGLVYELYAPPLEDRDRQATVPNLTETVAIISKNLQDKCKRRMEKTLDRFSLSI